jgi:hypothetical protein
MMQHSDYCMLLCVGNQLRIEAVSPSTVILNPPEKLVLEIRTSGGYRRTRWSKEENLEPFLPDESLTHFGEIYFAENTSLDDLGRYSVYLEPQPGQIQTSNVSFLVISYGTCIDTPSLHPLSELPLSLPPHSGLLFVPCRNLWSTSCSC